MFWVFNANVSKNSPSANGPAPGGGGVGKPQDYEWNVDGKYGIIEVDFVKFQKTTMKSNWKTFDQTYKYLGLFTGQTVKFGVEYNPSDINIPNSFLAWGGLASGDTPELSVTFTTAGLLQAINVTYRNTTKTALVEIRDKPSGIGEKAYASLHAVYTAIALSHNLIGSAYNTLEPFIWANGAYPGSQHNTKADAARHSYWTCLLTRYTLNGYALGLSTQHEVSSPGPSTETVMDLNNNLMGILIEGNHTHFVELGCCRAAVKKAIFGGTLRYLDSSYGVLNTTEDALLQPTNKP